MGPFQILVVEGTHDPTDFVINAYTLGWNATANKNPTIIEYRGIPFTEEARHRDSIHSFAIYTKNFPSFQVNTGNTCSIDNTNGCLARAPANPNDFISSTNPTVLLTFTPKVPGDDGTGVGEYEYYCQLHPGSMHGKLRIFKNPDVNLDGTVGITDLEIVGSTFLSNPTMSRWVATADVDNNFAVNILDLVIVGHLFLNTLAD